MFLRLNPDVQYKFCTYLTLLGHVNLTRCCKQAKTFTQHPLALTYENVDINQSKLPALKYHPIGINTIDHIDLTGHDCSSVMYLSTQHNIKGIAELKNLRRIKSDRPYPLKLFPKLNTVYVDYDIDPNDFIRESTDNITLNRYLEPAGSKFIDNIITRDIKIKSLSMKHCEMPRNIASLVSLETLILQDVIIVDHIKIPSLKRLILLEGEARQINNIDLRNLDDIIIDINNNDVGIMIQNQVKIEAVKNKGIGIYTTGNCQFPNFILRLTTYLEATNNIYIGIPVLWAMPGLKLMNVRFDNDNSSFKIRHLRHWLDLDVFQIDGNIQLLNDLIEWVYDTSHPGDHYIIQVDQYHIWDVKESIIARKANNLFKAELLG